MSIASDIVSVAKDLIAGEGLFDIMSEMMKGMKIMIYTPDVGDVQLIGGSYAPSPTTFIPRRKSCVAMLVSSITVMPERPYINAEVVPGRRYMMVITITTAGGHMSDKIEAPLILRANAEDDLNRFLQTYVPHLVSRYLREHGAKMMEVSEGIHKSISEMYDGGRDMGD